MIARPTTLSAFHRWRIACVLVVVLLGIVAPSQANNAMRRIPHAFSNWAMLDAVPLDIRQRLLPDMWNIVDVPYVPVTGIWDLHVDPSLKKPSQVVDLPNRPAWNSSTGAWFELVTSDSTFGGGGETEVRVSWPASTPIDIDILLLAHSNQPGQQDATCPPSTCRRFVLVRAIWDAHTRPTSIDRAWTDQLPDHVLVRLVYEPVYFGIQSTAMPMIAILAVVVPLALLVVVPFVLRVLEGPKWVGEGSRRKSS